MEGCLLSPEQKAGHIKLFLENRITAEQLAELRHCVNEKDLAVIIQRIYDLNEKQVLDVAALDSVMAFADTIKNTRRNAVFTNKINHNFRNGNNKIILAEGDSWFNYPIILSDVVDWIAMEKNMAVYSLANAGDWLLNMLHQRKYVEDLSVLHPEFFLMSAGGNDLVGKSRIGAIVDPSGHSGEFDHNEFAKQLMVKVRTNPVVPLDEPKFEDGLKYLSKDFYALLMFFHLQYYFLMNGILNGGKFPGIKIITQGYDFAIPQHNGGWRFNPLHWFKPFIRMFLGNGTWLKTPLQMRGILDPATQENIVYAMIYLFNEMMIKTGSLFCEMKGLEKSVFHVDSRGSAGRNGWTDELHLLPEHFKNTGMTFIDCINGVPSKNGQVYVVNQMHP
ncbi:MAG TPA: hypothetical protein VFE53_23945 [Mucilaginibacter sp.]|nr:hypothetical protein [Mucilaginibacter sp.]